MTGLTGISDDAVSDSQPFKQVAQDFLIFLFNHSTNKNVVLVAHNGFSFDIPFAELQRNKISTSHIQIKGQLDTLAPAKLVSSQSSHPSKLQTVYTLQVCNWR